MDTLIQRVKSLEAQAGGLPWTSAQRLELLPSDTASLSSRQERHCLIVVEAGAQDRNFGAAGRASGASVGRLVDHK